MKGIIFTDRLLEAILMPNVRNVAIKYDKKAPSGDGANQTTTENIDYNVQKIPTRSVAELPNKPQPMGELISEEYVAKTAEQNRNKTQQSGNPLDAFSDFATTLSRGDRMILDALNMMKAGYPIMQTMAWLNYPSPINFYENFGENVVREYRDTYRKIRDTVNAQIANARAFRNAMARKIMESSRNRQQAMAQIKALDAELQARINQIMSDAAKTMQMATEAYADKALYTDRAQREGALAAAIKRTQIYEQGNAGSWPIYTRNCCYAAGSW
ncbi:MAG: hypothetical protein KatS3mg083_251 [Candidatus Dojkabacteria bacterium]|nr:MAG: hypothetical protein KatS3mg083_251 [Candidatus Dojkabacteria bacterium]